MAKTNVDTFDRPVNGAENAAWMMGASLNPSSEMAKDMNVALEDEIKAHSAYDPNKDKHYLGVPFPGARRVSNLPPTSYCTHTHVCLYGKWMLGSDTHLQCRKFQSKFLHLKGDTTPWVLCFILYLLLAATRSIQSDSQRERHSRRREVAASDFGGAFRATVGAGEPVPHGASQPL